MNTLEVIANQLNCYDILNHFGIDYRQNMNVPCPIHHGDDNNFSISADEKMFTCFSHHCGEGFKRDAINLYCLIEYGGTLQQLDKSQKATAIQTLANLAGVELKDQRHNNQPTFTENKPDPLMDSIGLAKTPVDHAIDSIRSKEHRPIPLTQFKRTSSSNFLLPGTYNVLCGDPGAGKSFFSLALVMECISKNISTRYLPLESDSVFQTRRLASMLGKSFDPLLNPEDCPDADSKAIAAIEAVRSELTFISPAIEPNPCLPDSKGVIQNVDSDYIISWLEFQFNKGVKVAIIDNMTMISFDARNTYEDQNRFIRKLVSTASQYKSVVILVAHTTKKREGRFSLGDIQGTSQIGKLASSALMLESHVDKESTVYRNNGAVEEIEHNRTMHIAKARSGKGSGMQIAFNFGCNGANFDELGFIKPKNSR